MLPPDEEWGLTMAKQRCIGTDKPQGTCTFCSIAAGEANAEIVFQDAESMAFLDRRPLFPGHCLLISKTHYESMLDLPEDLVGRIFVKAQLLARSVQAVMKAEGTFVAVNNRVSQSVPHFHIHVVPRRRGDGLKGFFWPRRRYESQEKLVEVQKALASHLKHFVF